MKRYIPLQESSLSRIWGHNLEHDCGAITAFRKYKDFEDTILFTKAEKLQRNHSLSAKLTSLGYNITELKGQYPEGGSVGKENSFFVVDVRDTGRLERDLRELGEDFQQDSVLFIPKGAINNTGEKAYLIGTNHHPKNQLRYGEKLVFNKGHLSKTSPIYTSFINGRPFIFESIGEEIRQPATGFGHWYIHEIAKRHWSKIDITGQK